MTLPIVVNIKKTPDWRGYGDDAYIGRPSAFGNPHRVGWCQTCEEHHTREEAIELYRLRALNNPTLRAAILELRGKKRLGCFCKPKECHGDIIIEVLRGTDGGRDGSVDEYQV